MGRPTIELRSTSMPYEQLGSGILSGVWPENVQSQHGPNGPEQATWVLRRDPDIEWPDLSPFNQVVIRDEGLVSWTGRLQETPTTKGSADEKIEVVAEGWLAHLSDDAARLRLVNNDLTSWANQRALASNPAIWNGQWTVDAPSGAIHVSATAGAAINTLGGVVLDAGPGRTWKTLWLSWFGGGAANMELRVAGCDSPASLDEVTVVDITPISTTTASTTVVMATPRRYLTIYGVATAAIAAGAGAWFEVSNAIAVSQAAYISGGASILKASDAIIRALSFAPLISQSTAEITVPSFNIPHFDGPYATPRENIDAANGYHGYQVKLQDDPAGGQPRLRFRAIPTVPTVMARIGAGIEFSDASRNDGGDIYNRVIVTYTDAGGNETQAVRTTSEALLAAGLSAPFDTSSTAAISNPSFDVNTAGWTFVTGVLTRDTGVFDTSPASGRWTSTAGGSVQGVMDVTGLTVGRTYRLTLRARAAAAWAGGTIRLQVVDLLTAAPAAVVLATEDITNAIGTAFATRTYTFTAISSAVQFQMTTLFSLTPSVDIIYLDTLQMLESRPTLPDRQGFVRTKILNTGSRLTAAAANQIGDVFLLAHQVTPLRGSLRLSGGSLEDIISGQKIPLGLLGRYVNDAVLLTEGDPDTSAQGRVGIIAGVSLDHAAGTADLQIDSRKDFLDVLLDRFSVFQSGA